MTTVRRLALRLIGRLPNRSDDRGSLAMAMMAVLVGALLGAVILPMVISQVKSTRTDTTRTQSLHAAQTGLDVMLGRIRANVSGDPKQLPCGLEASSDDAVYDVSVDYYSTSPSDESLMMCKPSFGTYNDDPTAGESMATPRYAIIQSTGRAGVASDSKGRTLVSTYSFQTNDGNALGGQIRLFPGKTALKSCIEAGSTNPDAGTTPIALAECGNPGSPPDEQLFAYRADLSIQLVSSVGEDNQNGLCVDTTALIHAAGVPVVLDRCASDPSMCADLADCSPSHQQWSFTDDGRFKGALPDRSGTDDYCIAPEQSQARSLLLAQCAGKAEDPQQAWVPSPATGAGMAGPLTQQLVNRQLFATCLHIPAKNPELGFLVLFTCDQGPDRKVTWNQRFELKPNQPAASPAARLPQLVLMRITAPNDKVYCLRHTPSTTPGDSTVGVDDGCPQVATLTSSYSWMSYQDKNDDGTDLQSTTHEYAIVPADQPDSCLTLGTNSGRWSPDPSAGARQSRYLKATVATCDGGAKGQKWNVRASPAQVTDTHEIRTPTE